MNRSVRHLRWAATALLAAGLVAAGCAGPQTAPQGEGAKGGSVSIVLYQKPKLFSPLEPAHGPDQQVMTLIYRSLMTPSPDLKLEPQLAEKVDVNDDATEFTFHLRKGLKWSDGKPFTSGGRPVHPSGAGQPEEHVAGDRLVQGHRGRQGGRRRHRGHRVRDDRAGREHVRRQDHLTQLRHPGADRHQHDPAEAHPGRQAGRELAKDPLFRTRRSGSARSRSTSTRPTSTST